MTFQVILLIFIVAVALVVFIGGWLTVDVVGLLVLSVLALTGLVTADEALAGFSSPAVVTVWAMFILSAGLNRTGVAHRLGQPLQHFAKGSEVLLVVVLMTAAALLSALINTVTVAAILLPATMELARRSGRPPSRLLMPLALGCLLGGPFTGISTPPNIIATDALRSAGLEPFAIFDYTPITGAVVVAGIIFVALCGRRLLPVRSKLSDADSALTGGDAYQLDTHIFTTRIRPDSKLAGRTLAESRIGSALFLTVLALQRKGQLVLAPRPTDVLEVDDELIMHGQPDHLQRLEGSQHLQIEAPDAVQERACRRLLAGECRVAANSPLLGATLAESGLRPRYRVHVLALFSPEGDLIRDARRHRFAEGDRLLLQGEQEALDALERTGLVTAPRLVTQPEADRLTHGHARLLPVRVPSGSVLSDRDLVESRLGNAFGLTVAGIIRGDSMICMPSPHEKVQGGDLLMVQGAPQDLEILEGLQALEITEQSAGLMAELGSQQIGVTEILLSPRTTLAGRTLSDLLFRDHYGISVLAIWRNGRAHRSGLQDMPLKFGDALLVYGQRQKLAAVARDPDFLVLDPAAAQAPRLEKAGIAAAIMLAVLLSAILGWVPIAIAAVCGSALMVMAGCLTMQEAYRAIEWRVIFLIAGMLPLGVAIQHSGAAQMGAGVLVALVGDLGPRWVVAALYLATVIGTQVIPTAALVVLMAPVALSTAATLGISPHLLMMTVAISASASFASPLSHPAHLLVMGPGGYRFTDYVKVGVPLTVVSFAVSVWLLPILWPAS